MGKMRLSSGQKTELGQALIQGMEDIVEAKPVEPGISKQQFDLAIAEVMEKHSKTFNRLAEAEEREKLRKPYVCKTEYVAPKHYSDYWARKHAVLLRADFEADRKELDGLLKMYAESTDIKLKALEAGLEAANDYIQLVNQSIPEEIQVVKETIIERPVTDKKVWMAIGLTILLNIAYILLK